MKALLSLAGVSALIFLAGGCNSDKNCSWKYAIRGKLYSATDSLPYANAALKLSSIKPWTSKDKEVVLETFSTGSDGSFSLTDINSCKYNSVVICWPYQDMLKDSVIKIIETPIGDNHNRDIDLGIIYTNP